MSNDLTYDQLLSLSLPSSSPYTKAVVGAANSTVYAPDGNSAVRSGGNDLMIGGTGDNTYFVYYSQDMIQEASNAGIDTVNSLRTYVLPDNVENLRLSGNGPYGPGGMVGVGNSLNNLITGDAGSQTLDGGGGNDILTGGGGADIFVVRAGQGSDLITDFGNGADRIRLEGFGLTSFAQIQAAASQIGNDVVIQLPGDEAIGLKNVTLASLAADQFMLGLDRSDLVQTFGDQFDSFSQYDAVANPTGTWRTVYSDGPGSGGRTASYQGEKQIYVDSTIGLSPFAVDNGVLTITAADTPEAMQSQFYGYKYTSGLITSKLSHSQLYGVFEITAKLPGQSGAWPAFWLMPTDGTKITELDVFESLLFDPTLVTNTIHSGANGVQTGGYVSNYVPDAQAQFHTYAVDWEPDTITWYIDGAKTYSYATPADMHRPMYMLANVAVGGGGITPTGPFNTTMQIDSINAYQHGTALIGTGSNDVFTVTSRDQIVQEVPGGTNNTVYSSIDYLLPDNVQTLVLTGSANLSGFANAWDSTIIGNAGNDFLEGSFGNDVIIGGNGTNKLIGAAGNDTLVVGTGNNTVSGGDGLDTLVIAGRPSDYLDGVSRGTGNLTNRATGAVDALSSVEVIRFDNGTLSMDAYTVTAAPQQLVRLFYTALGRMPTANELSTLIAPMPAHAQNWTEPFAGNLDLAGMAAQVMSGSEYKAATAGLNPSQQVAWFYKAALLNVTDFGGLAYWQDQAAHGVPLTTILTSISESSPVQLQTWQTIYGVFVPDPSMPADVPVVPSREYTIASGSTLSLTDGQLLAGAKDPDGQLLSLNFVGRAQHGTVSFANSTVTFTANPYFSGDASFTYTVLNRDHVATTATVTVHVTGSAPSYISDSAATADKVYDFSGYSTRHQVVVGSGHDTVYAGSGGDSFRLGSGTYTVIGGNGADQITFGTGVATVYGGAGGDAFTFIKGAIADPAANGGNSDTIIDFSGAGNGARSGDDIIRLVGFSSAATLSFVGNTAGDATGHIYAVDDAGYHASFIVHYASDGPQLVRGDYGFFAS